MSVYVRVCKSECVHPGVAVVEARVCMYTRVRHGSMYENVRVCMCDGVHVYIGVTYEAGVYRCVHMSQWGASFARIHTQ